jgi:hypothetical protein
MWKMNGGVCVRHRGHELFLRFVASQLRINAPAQIGLALSYYLMGVLFACNSTTSPNPSSQRCAAANSSDSRVWEYSFRVMVGLA